MIDGKNSPSLSPPTTITPQSHLWTQCKKQVPSFSFDKVTHWCPDARFFLDQWAVPLNQEEPCWKQGWICVAMTLNWEAEIICVDGFGVSLFIGHVTPWGRTNWWPQRALCFVPTAHKSIRVRLRREWGGGVEGKQQWDEQVSHRMAGWDELEGGLATGLRQNTTHSFTHPLTHSYTHTYTHT